MPLSHDLKDKAILVTGAAGCIGAWVVKLLSDMGAKPVVYDLSDNRARLDLIMEGTEDITWVRGDITDYDQLCETLKAHDVFAIIHLAALQVPFCKADPVGSVKVNVLGTTHIFEAARQLGISRISYASSIAAPAMGENDWLDTLYGAHKVCGEQMAKVYWQDWQVPSLCIRPGVIYGPGRDQGMSAAPTIAMLAALFGESYTVPFAGPVAFVHVEDAALRFIAAVATPMEGAHVFDMQGTPMEIADVITLIKDNVQGAEVGFTGAALPFPHAEDDGALDKHIKVPAYRRFDTGVSDTLSIFEQARQRGALTSEQVTDLIGKNS